MILGSMMKFCLGHLSITPAALTSIPADDICGALDQHVCGQWGNLTDEACAENERALLSNAPLLSVYRAPDGREFRVLTTGDRSQTVVHMPFDSVPQH